VSRSRVDVVPGVVIGGELPVCVAGMCAVEGREITLRAAEGVAAAAAAVGMPAVFKASFDKANRTSIRGFRGIGVDEGLRVLQEAREVSGLPILTDVHLPAQAAVAAEVADVLQVPAFLCRQTDLLVAVALTGRPMNIKKGQFVSPHDMAHAVDKARSAGAAGVVLTERGTSFGYNDLVVDLRSLPTMRGLGCPVLFDATHAVQRPSAGGDRSGGDRSLVPTLLRAAVAAGVDGVYLEVHEDPDSALSDGPNSLPLTALPAVLRQVRALAELVASFPADPDLLNPPKARDPV
jgi:2-dehydro-3-deoxyphosphooctonate aldolase (KDO 8-P synthase)